MSDTTNPNYPDPNDFSRLPEKDVFNWLDQHELAHHTVTHAPTHSVKESSELKSDIVGGHTKNLFLKDKKGQIVLVSAWAHAELRLNQLHKIIQTQRLSFAKPELLWETLKVTPGSVSAFSLLHDTEKHVRFLADKKLQQYEVLNFHPLRNDMTTSISQNDFAKFVETTDHSLEWIDFTEI